MADRRLTDLELERLLAEDHPAERVRTLEAAMTDADRARLAELRRESDSALAGVDVEAEARRIRARASAVEPQRRPRWLRLFAPAAGLAAAAAIAAIVVTRERPSEDPIGIKGGEVALVVHVAPPGAPSRRLRGGEELQPGDRMRFEVRAAAPGHVAVVGLDARGPTIYYPFGGRSPAAYDPAEPTLSGSIELDETLGTERVFILYSRAPFDLEAAVKALVEGGALPSTISSESVSFVKIPKVL